MKLEALLKELTPKSADDRQLLSELLGKTWTELYRDHHEELAPAIVLEAREKWQRLKSGEPLAYVLGFKEFCGRRFIVDSRVLIPREETEALVDFIRQELGGPIKIADLGTGSGCLALSILLANAEATAVALDISKAALEVAKLNAQKLELKNRVEFKNGAVEEWHSRAEFDVVVANPPYIAKDDRDVQESVRDFEPHVALFAEDSGLEKIVSWLAVATEALKPEGRLYFEMGWNQGEAAKSAANNLKSLVNIEIRKDFSGHDRYLLAQKRKSSWIE